MYAATLAWSINRFMLTEAVIMEWQMRQTDFTLVYTQVEGECQLYMEIPKGFEIPGGNTKNCLKILKNIYRQQQAGCIWSLQPKEGLQRCGFLQSDVDEYIFYKEQVIFMVYIDNAILLSPNNSYIDKSLNELRQTLK